MSLEIQITFDAHDPPALADFWATALGYVIALPPGASGRDDQDPWQAWDRFLDRIGVPADERRARAAAEDPEGGGPRLFFQRVPEGKTAKNRVHLDVRVAPGLEGADRMTALEQECERLVALGATRRRRFEPQPPLETGFIVMADPEGNEFCLD